MDRTSRNARENKNNNNNGKSYSQMERYLQMQETHAKRAETAHLNNKHNAAKATMLKETSPQKVEKQKYTIINVKKIKILQHYLEVIRLETG